MYKSAPSATDEEILNMLDAAINLVMDEKTKELLIEARESFKTKESI